MQLQAKPKVDVARITARTTSRTPLKTEAKWGVGVFVVVVLIWIAGFVLMVSRLRAL